MGRFMDMGCCFGVWECQICGKKFKDMSEKFERDGMCVCEECAETLDEMKGHEI